MWGGGGWRNGEYSREWHTQVCINMNGMFVREENKEGL